VTSIRLPDVRRAFSRRYASTNRRIFVAMVIVGVATLLAKVLGMAKDMVVASYFGTSDAVDAFFIALAVPSFAINVIAGTLPAALVPVYLRVYERDGTRAAGRLLSDMLILAAASLAAASVVLVLLAPLFLPLVGATFGGEKLALTRNLFLWILPGVFVSGLSGALGSVLNAHDRFLVAAVTPVFNTLLIIAFLFGAADHWGIYALAIGLSVGYLSELLILGWNTWSRGLLARPRWLGWRDPEVRQVLSQYAPLVIGGAVMSTSPLIDQAMAATLGSGSVAQLTYGSKIVAAGMGIGVTALSTAIFPHFARMVAARDWPAVRHSVRTYSRLVLAAAIPAALLIIVFSSTIIRTVFERGQFSTADTQVVARIQALYALQIPFYVLGIMGVQLLHAISANRVLMWVSIGNFFTNIIGNYVLMRLWGVAGIALATSIVYLLSMVVILSAVSRRLGSLENEPSQPLRAEREQGVGE
jgi:putative peptidoglycan lipid II flippase